MHQSRESEEFIRNAQFFIFAENKRLVVFSCNLLEMVFRDSSDKWCFILSGIVTVKFYNHQNSLIIWMIERIELELQMPNRQFPNLY